MRKPRICMLHKMWMAKGVCVTKNVNEKGNSSSSRSSRSRSSSNTNYNCIQQKMCSLYSYFSIFYGPFSRSFRDFPHTFSFPSSTLSLSRSHSIFYIHHIKHKYRKFTHENMKPQNICVYMRIHITDTLHACKI